MLVTWIKIRFFLKNNVIGYILSFFSYFSTNNDCLCSQNDSPIACSITSGPAYA
jgi:hypothetical protein